jgi:tRNA A37 methylthiotransferase MiaB
MPDQVPPHVKAQRAQRLAALEAQLRTEYFAALRGAPLRVLVESTSAKDRDCLLGTACRYAPVELSGPSTWRGRLIDVHAEGTQDGKLVAVAESIDAQESSSCV